MNDGQISIFEYMQDKHKRVRPCECGNDRLAVRYTGCGIPNQFSPVVTYDAYLFCIFCPECFRVAMAGNHEDAWRSNKTSIDDAIRDWNNHRHREEADKAIGRYGHKHYAEVMSDTLARFPKEKEKLYV